MTLANIHLPESVEAKLAELAAADGVTVEQFITDAINAKVSQRLTMKKLQESAKDVTREQFEAAPKRPFRNWLKALGVPSPDSLPAAEDWPALAARSAGQWRQQPGIGPVRAMQLERFFHEPEVVRLREQLHNLGVDGF